MQTSPNVGDVPQAVRRRQAETQFARASGVAARRILVKAASLSPKNIVPKAKVSKSYSSGAVDGVKTSFLGTSAFSCGEVVAKRLWRNHWIVISEGGRP